MTNSEPVTPETLTDEMIRGEQLLAPGLTRWKAFQRVLDCDSALHGGDTPQETAAARQRVCDAINARMKEAGAGSVQCRALRETAIGPYDRTHLCILARGHEERGEYAFDGKLYHQDSAGRLFPVIGGKP